MSYAADGQLEPKFIDEVNEYDFPDVMGYKVSIKLWEDGMYTAHIDRVDEYGTSDTIQDGEVDYAFFPDEEEIRTVIEDTLEGRFDRSIG